VDQEVIGYEWMPTILVSRYFYASSGDRNNPNSAICKLIKLPTNHYSVIFSLKGSFAFGNDLEQTQGSAANLK
jgi:hypothetical protein